MVTTRCPRWKTPIAPGSMIWSSAAPVGCWPVAKLLRGNKRPQLLGDCRRNRQRLGRSPFADAATDGRHFAAGQLLPVAQKPVRVGHAPLAQPRDPNLDLKHVFEMGRRLKIAPGRYPWPTDLTAGIVRHNRLSDAPEQV